LPQGDPALKATYETPFPIFFATRQVWTNLYFLEGESWRVFNIFTNRLFAPNLRLVSLMVVVAVTFLFSLLEQTSWAAVIKCPATSAVCNGTSGDDIIFAADSGGSPIHGLAGNDYIIGSGIKPNYIWGEDGNDILVGSAGNDYLNAGKGNDRYEGGDGSDSIVDIPYVEGSLVNNDDTISGGVGDDWILSGEGVDRIYGGGGNDQIYPNTWNHRDFSYDFVDCGSGTGDRVFYGYSSDAEGFSNCEFVMDQDR
jgi:Ca2+-binding RTX toxin-like protein